MHIAEGILPLTWSIATTAAAVPFIARGAQQMQTEATKDPSKKPLYGLIGAAVFVLSALPIPVPIAGTCSHPTGIGMAAILIKPFPAAAITVVALLIQALFMAHGGLTTLGANTLHMGVAGAFASYFIFVTLRRLHVRLWISAAAAGAVADLATYGATALTLGLALHGDQPWLPVVGTIFAAFMPTQIPLAILEAVITAGMVNFIVSRRPDIAINLGLTTGDQSAALGPAAIGDVHRSLPNRILSHWPWLAALALPVWVIASALSNSKAWEGVDVSVIGEYASKAGRAAATPLINIQGDLLLFSFAIAGVIGGFIAGYYWRGIFDRRKREQAMPASESETVDR
jgi:cobalt/nickel transport system permease protein